MNENTRFEEYERKTRKIILTIGIIAGIFFLFGLLVISSDEETRIFFRMFLLIRNRCL